MIRVFVLPFVLGTAIVLVAVALYCLLEVLLKGYADYDRGLWEGAALVVTMNGANAIANLVLKRMRKKEEKRS